MKQPVVLKIFKGTTLESVRQFAQAQIVIGSTNEAQLELQAEGVALLHAMIEERDGEYVVSDLGSTSGTFKNGARILEDRLAPGDEITVGEYRLQFFIGVPKPSAPPKALETGAHPIQPPRAMSFSQDAPPASPVSEAPPLPTAPPTPPPTGGEGIAARAPAPTPTASAPKAQVTKAPKAAAHGSHKKNKTFAPANPYGSVSEIIKPGKGNVVEVLVTWNNKILSTNHFSRTGSVYLSSDSSADVIVPILAAQSKYELVKLQSQVTVCLTQEMTGEVTDEKGEVTSLAELARQNRVRNVGTHFELDLRQGEVVRVGLQNELISIFVRFKAQTPTVALAPLLDMTSSEMTGLLMALAVSLIMGLYMNVIAPSQLNEDEAMQEQPVRWAVVKFKAPPVKKVEEPPPETPPPEKKVVQVTEKKAEPKKVQQAAAKPAETKAGDPGKAGEPAPNPNAKPNPNKVASSKPGGAIKTASKDGANMKSATQDVTKTGLLGAFASKGAQKAVDKAYSGAGELAGMADQATGVAGSSETRAGDSFGTKLKDATSGKGSSTIGIAGVGTQGRGTGTTGYGTGGIGQRGSAQINIEGAEGAQTGGMDREAIRRVIRDHLREIRNCYERELQRSPDLFGKLSLQWDINEGGRVSNVEVKSNSLGNAAVAGCIASRLKTWKFPDPPKDQIGRVVYPFVFSSQ